MEQLITVNWSQHDSFQVGAIRNFFQSSQFTDCVLVCFGQVIYIHKLILAVSSPFFYELFNTHPSVAYEMHGISYDVLFNIIELIYTGSVQVLRVPMDQFLYFCNHLRLIGIDSLEFKTISPVEASPTIYNYKRTPSRTIKSIRKTYQSPKLSKIKRLSKAKRRLIFNKQESMDTTN